ncbi:histidine kinase [Pseudidiomarina tainanensis]|jgi:two-component system sensor histidine kinase QseC|uniref:histidine kinase n=2 Tax=Pseudidiomarina TaxID=2800384 RepID=A0A1I6G5L6_9GAMM|nr:histidine kinase [Pseudidiomarina tainanensis]SFR37462.1 two-component system, OmpR family, sensor histidine kinase QseC [Pseudidiomarina maritima]
MQLISRLRKKFRSIRRRILVFVSAVYLISSGLSAIWIYYEVSHEVDELFDAEMVQQAKTLAAFLPEHLTEQHLDLGSRILGDVSNHEYEDKLSYRIVDLDSEWSIRTLGAPSQQQVPFKLGFSTIHLDGEIWHAFGMNSGNYHVLLLQEDSFRSELRSDLATDTLVPVLILLPMMLWLGWWTINQSFVSFQRLASHLRKRRPDDYSAIEPANDDEEVAVVKQALNYYLGRIEQTFHREKRFSADAAHELRTPLASLKASLQNLISSKEQPQQDQLKNLLYSTDRLIQLVESLLLLSRAELPPTQIEKVNIAKEVRQIIAEYYALAEAKGLTFDVDLPELLTVDGNLDYWRVLLANLIDNAIKYSPQHTRIEITLKADSLQIKNAIVEDHRVDVERLSERFYRGKHLDVQGAGLGLSIVQNLARQLGVSVEFSHQQQYFICRVQWGDNL